MRKNKDGTPDKRYKKQTPTEKALEEVNSKFESDFKEIKSSDDGSLTKDNVKEKYLATRKEPLNFAVKEDPNKLIARLLKENGLTQDWDVVAKGTLLPTEYGVIKLEKDTLVLKTTYV